MKFLEIIRTKYRIKKLFKKRLGYTLKLKKPRSYCEKIQWLKFNHNANDQKLIERADKYLVRSYIEKKGFGCHLVKLFGCWEKAEQIDWQQLPQRFVLKLNNASGSKYCWFIHDKSTIFIPLLTNEIEERLTDQFGRRYGEFHYGKMPPKIIAEEFLQEENGTSIKDYKFYAFHGRVAFFSVEEGKLDGRHVRDYYSTDWKKHPVAFSKDVSPPECPFTRPSNFDQMLFLAETLSEGYPHLRVDLYNVNGQIYFGELTYTPENGLTRWKPLSLDFEYGSLMNVYDINH